jgi:hypothetical protein
VVGRADADQRGLFAGGVALIVWDRIPAWRASDPVAFRTGLAHIQRRLVAFGSAPPLADLERLRARWLGGHLARTAVALVCFALAVVATVV